MAKLIKHTKYRKYLIATAILLMVVVGIAAFPKSDQYNTYEAHSKVYVGDGEMVLNPDNTKLYIARTVSVHNAKPDILVLNTSDLSYDSHITIDYTPGDLEFSIDGRSLFVGGINTLAIIDTDINSATYHTVLKTFPFEGLRDVSQLTMKPDNSTLYFSADSTNYKLDLDSYTVSSFNVFLGRGNLEFSPLGKETYTWEQNTPFDYVDNPKPYELPVQGNRITKVYTPHRLMNVWRLTSPPNPIKRTIWIGAPYMGKLTVVDSDSHKIIDEIAIDHEAVNPLGVALHTEVCSTSDGEKVIALYENILESYSVVTRNRVGKFVAPTLDILNSCNVSKNSKYVYMRSGTKIIKVRIDNLPATPKQSTTPIMPTPRATYVPLTSDIYSYYKSSNLATRFPSIPKSPLPTTDATSIEFSSTDPYLMIRYSSKDKIYVSRATPGTKLLLTGIVFLPKSEITSITLVPLFPPYDNPIDITPYSENIDLTSGSWKRQYFQTGHIGTFDVGIQIPDVYPGMYYIEVTVEQIITGETQSGSIFFEVLPKIGSTTVPPTPVLTPTPSPTNTPIPTTPIYIPPVTPFPSIPDPGTPVPRNSPQIGQAHIESETVQSDTGRLMRIKGSMFPRSSEITSMMFIPINVNDGVAVDVTPQEEYWDYTNHKPILSNLKISQGILDYWLTVPEVNPGLYYIEVTAEGLHIEVTAGFWPTGGKIVETVNRKSAAMLFRVTGDPKPTPTIPPTPIPTAVPTIMPVSVSVDRNETKSKNVHTFYSTAHDIYHGPNQICAEDL